MIDDIKKTLWATADKLRANMDAAEYKHLVLGLIFVKYISEVNVFWVSEAARWDSLRAAAKQPDIGKRIDDALSLIEVENLKLKGILDKRFARAQLPDGKLGQLVDLVSTIGFGQDAAQARDVLGQVYEYFLGMLRQAMPLGEEWA